MSRNRTQFIGSFSTPGGEGSTVMRERPRVSIILPDVSLAPEQTEWEIILPWTIEVENFAIESITTSGDNTGVTITDLQGSGDRYTVKLTLPANATGILNISVASNSANEVGYPDNQGPISSVGESLFFNTAAAAARQNILCTRERTGEALDDINSLIPIIGGEEGGYYRGIFSSAKLGNYIYFVTQIQRRGSTIQGGGRGTPITGRTSNRGLSTPDRTIPLQNHIRTVFQSPSPFIDPQADDNTLIVVLNAEIFLRIYVQDIQGRRIKYLAGDDNSLHLAEAPNNPTTHVFTWDGTNEDGERAAAGLYYVSLFFDEQGEGTGRQLRRNEWDGDRRLFLEPPGDIAILSRGAAAVLFRVDTRDCSFQIIKKYPHITMAARSLFAHDGRMYGFEGSHYGFLNDGNVTNFEDGIASYQRGRFEGVPKEWKKDCGNMFSIANSEREITQHGIWVSAEPADNPEHNPSDTDGFYGLHVGTASPLVATDDGVHIVSGYGDYALTASTEPEFEVNRYDNLAWVRYGAQLNQKIPVLRTNEQTAYEIIREIARITNSIISFQGDSFVLKPRAPLSALVGSDITDASTTITATDRNYGTDSYPSDGIVAIGNEVIRYSSLSNSVLGGLTRGYEQTDTAAHDEDASVVWIDHVLKLNTFTLEQPIDDITVYDDSANHYRAIEISYGNDSTYRKSLDDGEVPRRLVAEIEVPLAEENIEWVRWLAEEFLNRFGQLHQVVTLQLKPSLHLKLGEIIFIDCPERIHLSGPYQIIEVSHLIGERRTETRLVSL